MAARLHLVDHRRPAPPPVRRPHLADARRVLSAARCDTSRRRRRRPDGPRALWAACSVPGGPPRPSWRSSSRWPPRGRSCSSATRASVASETACRRSPPCSRSSPPTPRPAAGPSQARVATASLSIVAGVTIAQLEGLARHTASRCCVRCRTRRRCSAPAPRRSPVAPRSPRTTSRGRRGCCRRSGSSRAFPKYSARRRDRACPARARPTSSCWPRRSSRPACSEGLDREVSQALRRPDPARVGSPARRDRRLARSPAGRGHLTRRHNGSGLAGSRGTRLPLGRPRSGRRSRRPLPRARPQQSDRKPRRGRTCPDLRPRQPLHFALQPHWRTFVTGGEG